MCSCTLYKQDEDIRIEDDGLSCLFGSVVIPGQNLHITFAEPKVHGIFFVFTDVSVRIEGVFRLKFTLLNLADPSDSLLASCISKPFTVYSKRKFPGMKGIFR